jgi:PBP4 family serine-type D-alanyl-D-alanine carboxypeptidase
MIPRVRANAALLCALLVVLVVRAAPGADMSSVATVRKPSPGGSAWSALQLLSLQRALAALLEAPTLRGAHVGLYAIDTTRGTILFAHDADRDFMPASNFKLLVGSAALSQLGPSFTYVTAVGSGAAPRDGAIAGNLYLHGGGDALLGADDLRSAAATLAAQGIRRVDGALLTDASHFDSERYGSGWSWNDLPYDYAPVVSALELDDGIVHAYMTPGSAAGMPVALRVEPSSAASIIDNRLVTGPEGSKDTSEIVRPWNQPLQIQLVGSYPAGARESGDLRPSVPDPPSFAGGVLAQALAAQGIAIAGGVRDGKMPPATTTLWSHASEAMPQLLADLWYPSDNLMAEILLKELGVAQGGEPGSVVNGRIAEQQFLRSAGIDPATVTIADGSGLSQYDRITPRALVAILQADWNGPYRDIVLDALPVAGVRGTLKTSFLGTAAERTLFAKTGSISHVRALSGFVQSRTHGAITFSLLIEDWMDENNPGAAAALARVRSGIVSLLATS